LQILPIAVGDRVKVRRERWRVARIHPYETCSVIDLQGIGPRNRRNGRRILLPFEAVERVPVERRPRHVGARRWQRECRRLVAAAGGADALRSAQTADMDLMPHQLEPAIALVRGDTSRILIADDVGLGKTVQAGLIVAELLLRHAAERVLILTPAGLREQWLGELSGRFSLPFTLADAAAVRHRRAAIRPGANPWATFPLVVASLDYIKRPEVLPAVDRCRWDLVIVDEAHGAATAADRHAAVCRLAAGAPYVVLLTATPHHGDAGAFASLRAIGDHLDRLHVFRRTRLDVGMAANRRVHRLAVRPGSAEHEMYAGLERFSTAVMADHAERSSDVWLALSTLHKRALSSAFALLQTVNRRLVSLAVGHQPIELQLTLPLGHEPGEHDEEDSIPRWTCPALRDQGAERALLTAIAAAATAALDGQAKLRVLRRMVARIGEPVVVFTEYRDTLLHVRDRVFPDAALVHGGLSRPERQAALAAFERGDRRVLLATDAAGEGLNLHRTCRVVINLELPWNPMRLEQRIGRVDRIGQRRRVHAVHLVAANTREAGIFARLHQRLARARSEIGTPDPLGTFSGPEETGAAAIRVDVAGEHQRLVDARRLTWRDHDGGDGSVGAETDLLFTVARRRLRARLAPRMLAIVQMAIADGDGRWIAGEVKGLLLSLTRQRRYGSHAEMRRLLEEIAAGLAERALRGDDRWARQAAAIHEAFWRRRAERERAICGWVTRQQATPHQPGLFGRGHLLDDLAATSTVPAGAEDRAGSLEAAEHRRSFAPVLAAATALAVF
jgi:superfamily II DNA or RNA helicase